MLNNEVVGLPVAKRFAQVVEPFMREVDVDSIKYGYTFVEHHIRII